MSYRTRAEPQGRQFCNRNKRRAWTYRVKDHATDLSHILGTLGNTTFRQFTEVPRKCEREVSTGRVAHEDDVLCSHNVSEDSDADEVQLTEASKPRSLVKNRYPARASSRHAGNAVSTESDLR